MSAPMLKTERFVIRAFEKQDLKAFAHYRSQKVVARYQSWTDFSHEDAAEFFERMDYSTFGKQGAWYQLAIAAKETDELVGDVAIHFMDADQVEIGCTIAPEHQGAAVASEAIARLLTYLFDELKKHRVIAITDTKNTAAYSLLEKLGFRREAHFIKNIFFKGAWGDEYQYALLRGELRSEF